jgi:hypothetical protein
MKKRMLLLAIVALALPLAAFADNTITFTTTGGTMQGDSQGLIFTGLNITNESGLPGGPFSGSGLGTINFQSGILMNAGAASGGNIAPGGSITITGNGSNGSPSGALFTGSFTQIQWWTVTFPDGTKQYTFTGFASGTDNNGVFESGQVMFTMNTGINWFSGNPTTGPASGSVNLAVPEPAEISFLGMGLLGLLGAIRRKVTA